MNKKYHITPNSEVKPCTAEPGNCRYAPNRHFNDYKLAQEYADDEMVGLNRYQEFTEFIDKEILTLLHIQEHAKIKEFRALQERVKENALYGAESPKMYALNQVHSPEKMAEIREMLNFALPNQKDSSVHLIVEDSYNYYIWTNSSDQRDVIVYDKYADRFPITEVDKKSKYITKIEVKDLTKQAQLSQTELAHKSTKGLTLNNDNVTEKIQKQLDMWDPRQHAYENKILKLTQEESYDYFLNDYYSKDCKLLMFYSDKQKEYIKIPLTEKDKANNFEQAKNILKANNIEVDVQVRCNMSASTKKVSQKDKARFLQDYGSMFKDGVAKERFTLADLNANSRNTLKGIPNKAYVREEKVMLPTYVNPKGSKRPKCFIRLGEFFFETKDDRIDPNREFTLDDFKMFKPLLMGNIRER